MKSTNRSEKQGTYQSKILYTVCIFDNVQIVPDGGGGCRQEGAVPAPAGAAGRKDDPHMQAGGRASSLHYSHSKLLYTTGRQLVTLELAGNGESSLDLGATITSFTVGLEQKEESGTGRRVVPAAVEAASVRWVEEHPFLALTWDSVAASLDTGLNHTYPT